MTDTKKKVVEHFKKIGHPLDQNSEAWSILLRGILRGLNADEIISNIEFGWTE